MEIPDGIQLTAFDADFYADPYPVYARLRQLDPIHRDKASFYDNSWTITDYDTVNQLLRDPRLSVDIRKIGLRRDPRADNAVTLKEPDMMNLDGVDHRRLRALVQKAFTPSSVALFQSRIADIAESCLDAISAPKFDLVTTYSKPLPTMVIAEYIGIDSHDHQLFKQWTDSLLLQGYPMPTPAQWAEIEAADKSLRDYVSQVIAQRRQQPQADLVTRLIQAQHDNANLSDSEIVDMVCLLIGAGNFTTTELISNSIFQCLANAAHRADFDALINECLRFDSPVLAVRRFVLEDIVLGQTTIPKNSVVNLMVSAANHDPQVFNDSEVFNGQRSPNTHLSFGRGLHHCLGAPLAKLEVKIAVQKFFERYPAAQLDSSKRSKRMDFRGFSALVVKA